MSYIILKQMKIHGENRQVIMIDEQNEVLTFKDDIEAKKIANILEINDSNILSSLEKPKFIVKKIE
jgi:hypothetical protein